MHTKKSKFENNAWISIYADNTYEIFSDEQNFNQMYCELRYVEKTMQSMFFMMILFVWEIHDNRIYLLESHSHSNTNAHEKIDISNKNAQISIYANNTYDEINSAFLLRNNTILFVQRTTLYKIRRNRGYSQIGIKQFPSSVVRRTLYRKNACNRGNTNSTI